MHSLADYSYDLPEALIAQAPVRERDQSRLFCLDRSTGTAIHRRFSDICDMLSPSDLLVANNTEVIPARLTGRKETGGRVEALILSCDGAENGDRTVPCLLNASKRLKPGAKILFGTDISARVADFSDGAYAIEFLNGHSCHEVLYEIGAMPLPPYIRRKRGTAPGCDDRRAYQTVYASQKGAVAAPTAGLHFSKELLDRLADRGVKRAEITLHVGYGTFLPVRESDIRNHRMHAERFYIPEAAAEAVNAARRAGGRIVAVGTTCVRTLEYASRPNGTVAAGTGSCDLFIYPGYEFKVVDALITNFHLPESTLLMLVSAFAGRERILAAYREAVERQYRFYSYGDAMFIE